MTSKSIDVELLRCPQCRNGALSIDQRREEMSCNNCALSYPVILGRPVLLRHDNEVFPLAAYRHADPAGAQSSGWTGSHLIPSPSVNLSRDRALRRIREYLPRDHRATVLVVGCGRQRQSLDEYFATDQSPRIIYSDVDIHADVDLYCDGHELPFADGVCDAVVTTAVLEHVLYPERVATEIHRVLKAGGVLYSELPFMQQVHEGAYDFTRYTLSGHRRLFSGFTEIDSGMVAGPGTALVWALESFVLAFVVRPRLRAIAKAVVRLSFAWIKYFDFFLAGRPAGMDGASCTYFLGAKIDGRRSDGEIVAAYVGANRLTHT